jgi:hypothetical protein
VLGEDDYERMLSFENPEQLISTIHDLEVKYTQGTVARLLKGIKPQLSRLCTFTMMVLLAVGGTSLSTACVWGVMSLMLEVIIAHIDGHS